MTEIHFPSSDAQYPLNHQQSANNRHFKQYVTVSNTPGISPQTTTKPSRRPHVSLAFNEAH